MRVRDSRPSEKRGKWDRLTDEALSVGKTDAISRERLIGGLILPHTSLFGKFPMAQIRPLYKNPHRHFYSAKLTPRESPHAIVADGSSR